jgi:two-component system response regulator TctD
MNTTPPRPRILIVDDEEPLRNIIAEHLHGIGFEVCCLGDAEAALEAIGAERFDAVVLDNNLPGMMGITALPQIVRRAAVPVVMITGDPNADVRRDALLLGARELLPKPLDLDALAVLVCDLVTP